MKRSIDFLDLLFAIIAWIGIIIIIISVFVLSWDLLFIGTGTSIVGTGLFEIRG